MGASVAFVPRYICHGSPRWQGDRGSFDSSATILELQYLRGTGFPLACGSQNSMRRNAGARQVVGTLAGWTLRDRSGLHWDLRWSLAAGQVRRFRRNGQSMSLNNSEDEITLLETAQVEQDRFGYTSSQEGVVIRRQ